MEDDAEFWPLSGKPLFNVILARSHVTRPYFLSIPKKMVRELPSSSEAVPVVLQYCGKSWNMSYLPFAKNKRLDHRGWKAFVVDNKLKMGYACFFELSDCSQTKIKFRVQIIKGDSESEEGTTSDTPIIIV